MKDKTEPSLTSRKLIRPAEAARLLCVTTRTLSNWARRPDSNGLPHYLVGGQKRYDQAEVLAFLTGGRRAANNYPARKEQG